MIMAEVLIGVLWHDHTSLRTDLRCRQIGLLRKRSLQMKRITLFRLLGLAVIVVAATRALCQVNVLTQHNDVRRSGANLQEKQLTVASVRQKFGRLWTLFADVQIGAQPLYVAHLTIAGQGAFSAVV